MVLLVLGFFVVVAVVALPLCLSLLKTPPGLPIPPGELVRVETSTRAISRGVSNSSAETVSGSVVRQ